MQPLPSESRYLIAILPSSALMQQLESLKQEISEMTGSKHAFNAPAHITLHMPFLLAHKNFFRLENMLTELSQSHSPFPINLVNFGAFPPKVVYVGVEENQELMNLQKQLTKSMRLLGIDNANYADRGFYPHITIAFRDLKKPAFIEAWNHYHQRQFSASFTAQGISLLSHDGTKWHLLKSFSFKIN